MPAVAAPTDTSVTPLADAFIALLDDVSAEIRATWAS
jgi:hypothetical protein